MNKATLAQGKALMERLLEADASVEEVQGLIGRFDLVKLMLKADLSTVSTVEFLKFLFREPCSLEEAWQIPNLVVIGPKEIADLFGVPLKSIPNPPLAISREHLEFKIAKRGNKLGLILRPKWIGSHRVNLSFLNSQFNEKGELIKKEKIKDPLFSHSGCYENRKATSVLQSASQIEAEWVLADLELPSWSFFSNSDKQKKEAAKRGLSLKRIPGDIYDLLMVAAVTGTRYREGVQARMADLSCFGSKHGHGHLDVKEYVVGFESSSSYLYIGAVIVSFPSGRESDVGISCEEVIS